MKSFKLFVISFSIISFFATSLLSKSISLCSGSHHVGKNFGKEFKTKEPSCHSSAKQEEKKQLCFECECYFGQFLLNISSSVSTLNIYKHNFDKFLKFNYSSNKKVQDPPPKIIS